MKVLLTGNKGFIGSQIELGLRSTEINYIGIDKEDQVPDDPFDLILHFGARTLIRNSLIYPYEYFQDNLDLTLKILEKCRKDSSKIVFPTSGSVQEATNPYSLSKKQGEEWVRLYSVSYGVESYILKLFNIYGETSKKGAVYLFCDAAVKNREITIYGDGSHVRDFVHVSDLVKLVLKIVEGQIMPGDFEVGTGIGTSINSLIQLIENFVGIKLAKKESDYVLLEAPELSAKKPAISDPLKLEDGVRRVVQHLEEIETHTT